MKSLLSGLLHNQKQIQISLMVRRARLSKICRRADDRVHQVCCGQGDHQVEERKVKIGGQEKVKVGDASLKSFATKKLTLLEESPKLLDFGDFKEVLRYNTSLLQKIQLKEDRRLKEAGEVEVNEVD